MKILKINRSNQKDIIKKTKKVVKNGGLIIYPTETCYGAGVNPKNKKAVDKLLEFKTQRNNKPISIAVPDKNTAKKYVHLNSQAKNLYQKFLPGPITVISKTKSKTDKRLESNNQTLGIRIPNQPFTLKLLQELKTPLTSTSANSSGTKQPYSLSDFQKYTAKKSQKLANLFLDAGKLEERPTSTIVDTTLQEPEVLREGAIKPPFTNKKITHSQDQTQLLAKKLTQKHLPLLEKGPLIITLQGELGAGKTQFAKGIGKALNPNQLIKSPTYTIINQHTFKNKIFYHIDTWRLEKGEELKNLGLDQMLKPHNIIAIEWPQKTKNLLSQLKNSYPIIWVNIEKTQKNTREISWKITKLK